LPNGKRFTTEAVATPSPANPNYMQVLRVPVLVPIDPIFAPVLDIEVRDTLFGGRITRLLGVASLPMSEFMVTTEKKKKLRADDLVWAKALAREDDALEAVAVAAALRKKKAAAAKKNRAKGRKDKLNAKLKRRGLKVKDTAEPVVTGASDDKTEIELGSFNGDDDHDDDDDDANAGGSGSGGVGVGVGEFASPPSDDEFQMADADADGDGGGGGDDEKGDVEPYMRGREVVDNELEDVLPMKPFDTFTFTSGRDGGGILSSKKVETGVLKALITLLPKDSVPSSSSSSTSSLSSSSSSSSSSSHRTSMVQQRTAAASVSIRKSMMQLNVGSARVPLNDVLQPKKLVCRLYVLRATNLISKDADGGADPYLVIKCGNFSANTRKTHVKNSLNPDFYDAFEFPVTLPGDARVGITLMDWDGVGDDFMGDTHIDIE
jgi:hypothetical protein